MTEESGSVQEIASILEDDHEKTDDWAMRLRKSLAHLQYEGKASRGKNLKQAQDAVQYFKSEMITHMEKEEKILFSYFVTHLPKLEPLISLLRSEHGDFKKALGSLELWLGQLEKEKNKPRIARLIRQLQEIGTYLIYLLRGHHREESEILYKVAERELRQDEKEELIARFFSTLFLEGKR